MSHPLTLEDFSGRLAPPQAAARQSPAPQEPHLAEDDALEAYDNGYKSGWADCATAEIEERKAVGADLARNLSEASLTYEAARRDVLAALGPFFEDLVAILLPRVAAAALTPTILEELGAVAESQSVAQVEILAAPSACPSLERLAETENLPDLKIRPEPAYGEGQVSLRLGNERRDLDLTEAAGRIADAIESFRTHVAEAELTRGAA